MYSGAIALIRSVLVTGAPGEGGRDQWVGAEDSSFQRPSPEETRLTFDGSPQIQARQLTGTKKQKTKEKRISGSRREDASPY